MLEEQNKFKAFMIYLEKDRLSKKDFFYRAITDEEIRNKRIPKELINYLKNRKEKTILK